MENPIPFLEYVATYLGNPLGGGNIYAAIAAGTVLMTAAIVLPILLRRNQSVFAAMMPWLCLALYALISAGVTGIGRLGLGVRQAMSYRYTTIASLLILAVLVMAAQWAVIRREKLPPVSTTSFMIAGLVLLLLGGTYIWSFVVGVQTMRRGKIYMSQGMAALKDYPRTSDESLLMLYPRIDIIRERVQILSKLGIIVPQQNNSSR
jgi:hypothetical protein